MAYDIRLDSIKDIKPEYLERIEVIRQEVIALDKKLQEIEDDHAKSDSKPGLRIITFARTNLETTLLYAVKSLCLLGEIK